MGKWAARLAAKAAAPPYAGTDKADKRGALSVLAVTPEGGADGFVARDGDGMSVTREATPAALDLAAVAWTDVDIAQFLDRRARLMRWGWAEADAEKLAERLVIRDREHDDRVSCTDCLHYRPGRCGNYGAALLTTADIGRDLAVTLQRCEGFAERKGLQ